MSTRCQVLVVSEPRGTPGRDHGKILAALYHHWDGYPGNMLKLLQEARERVVMHAGSVARGVLEAQRGEAARREGIGFAPSDWTPEKHAESARLRELDRGCDPARIASWIIAQEPDGYQLEPVTTLHGDLEYVYRVSGALSDGGRWGWFVRVDAIEFGENRGEQIERRAGRIVVDWCRLDSPAVDAEIAAHEREVAAYIAKRDAMAAL